MRILRERLGKDYHNRDTVTNRLYGRVIGGIALPSDKPGHVVVVAEGAAIRPSYPIYFICESSENTVNSLFRKALEFQSDCSVDGFYGHITDQAKQYLVNFNRQQHERQLKTLELYPAPNSNTGNIAYHVGLLVDALSPTEKTLFLENSQHLSQALKQMSLQDASGATDSDYPIVAALGYAVSLLIENPPISDFLRQENYRRDYDMLNYNN